MASRNGSLFEYLQALALQAVVESLNMTMCNGEIPFIDKY